MAERLYKWVGVLLGVISLSLLYINVTLLGNYNTLSLVIILVPILMGVVYFLIGIKKLTRNVTTDISIYVILGLTAVGWVSLKNITLLVVPLIILIIGLFLPKSKRENLI